MELGTRQVGKSSLVFIGFDKIFIDFGAFFVHFESFWVILGHSWRRENIFPDLCIFFHRLLWTPALFVYDIMSANNVLYSFLKYLKFSSRTFYFQFSR